MANLIQPMIGMIGVTACVWLAMYIRHLRYISKNNITPELIDTPENLNTKVPDNVNLPSNNLKNLFEMPVLFYALCLGAQILANQNYLAGLGWHGDLIGYAGLYELAWAYVVLRALHSILQCTYNKVMHRFTLYFLSCLLLWWIAIKVALMAFT